MSTTCTRCQNSGFLNIEQVIEDDWEMAADTESGDPRILEWMKKHSESDVQVCDCCGDGEKWYGIPGEHYNNEDPQGSTGPYSYNGGLCECH